MNEQLPRSPYDLVGGVIYFPRMLDKIRLDARGALPEGYHNNLGSGLDGHCLTFLRIEYRELRERAFAGGTDEEILEWCFVTVMLLHRSFLLIRSAVICLFGKTPYA